MFEDRIEIHGNLESEIEYKASDERREVDDSK